MKKLFILFSFILVNSFLIAQETNIFEGEYQIRPGFNITISSEGEDLFVMPTDKPKEKLAKINDSLFKVESINGTIDFSLIEKSDVIVVNMYGQILHAPRLPIKTEEENWEELEITADELTPFVGEYELSSQAKLTITNEDSKLIVQLTGQPGFPVFLYAENKFFYKVAKASLEFVKNAEGKITHLLLRQNGMIMQANKL